MANISTVLLKFVYFFFVFKPHSMVSYFSIVHILHLNTFPFMETCEQKKSSLKKMPIGISNKKKLRA